MNITINSTTISAVEYDEATEVLIVIFHNGQHYIYNGVPKMIFEEFMSATSKGRYYNAYIKGRYQ